MQALQKDAPMKCRNPSSIARALLAACAAAVLLAACSVLPKREPVQIWQPETGPAQAAATPAV